MSLPITLQGAQLSSRDILHTILRQDDIIPCDQSNEK
jgi:hypothetical protein